MLRILLQFPEQGWNDSIHGIKRLKTEFHNKFDKLRKLITRGLKKRGSGGNFPKRKGVEGAPY